MKKFGVLLVAAVLGGAIALGTFYLFDLQNKKTLKIEHVSQPLSQGAMYTADSNGQIVPLDFKSVSKQVMPAVVHIKSTQAAASASGRNQFNSPDPFRQFFKDDFFKEFFGPQFQYPDNRRGPRVNVGTGSGVIISDDGYIVTNNHVIANADDIEVTLNDNRNYKAKVIGTDPSTDLALLQIREDDLPSIPMLNSDDVEVGEWVLAVGNPFNLNSTVTAGIVSAKGRNINILKDKSAIEAFIQTDAAINPGNSGGALVNIQGGLVGINTAIASPTGSYTGYGFAIPSNMVTKVVEDLMKYGVVQRGFLGVTIRNVDGNLMEELDLDLNTGVYVDSVMANSAAEDANLKSGDVITQIENTEITSVPQLQELIARQRPGDKIQLEINRNGKDKTLNVWLKNSKGEKELIEKENKELTALLGAEYETLDKKTAKKLKIDGGVKITKLYAGKLRSQTAIKEGFIITKVGEKKVEDVNEFEQVINNADGGILVEGIYKDYPGVYYYAFGL
ncbi:MAG: Do family serine endopeptidase [Bacteroidia bacterium]|nr:Do family serine endopeptidase [Bacteroidia bacterium]NNM15512.1 Do family serine endopeptidase [Bacteroidia bacterium]